MPDAGQSEVERHKPMMDTIFAQYSFAIAEIYIFGQTQYNNTPYNVFKVTQFVSTQK